MSILIQKLKDIAAEHLRIKKADMVEFDIINSLPLSDTAVNVVENSVETGGVNSLKEINEDGLTDSNDTLIVCKCLTAQQVTLILLFSDPYELYEPTVLIKVLNIPFK